MTLAGQLTAQSDTMKIIIGIDHSPSVYFLICLLSSLCQEKDIINMRIVESILLFHKEKYDQILPERRIL